MIKLGQLFRDGFQFQLKQRLENKNNIFVLKFSKVTSPEMSDLRKELKKLGARMVVVKNSVAVRTLKNINLEAIEPMVEGSVALVYSDSDAADISKTLMKFIKSHESSQVKGGILQNAPLTAEDIKKLSTLPSREILLSMLLGAIQSPLSSLSYVLSYKTRALLCALKQISDKKKQ